MTPQYNEDSIQQLSGLEHIRLRPSGYINDTDVAGQHHILKELVDNAVDELSIIGERGELTVFIFINKDKQSYQTVVMDNGRGIPVGRLIDVYVNTMTSGKFDSKSYIASSGSFGIGASVTVALSKWFRAITLNQDVIGDVVLRHDDIPKTINTINNPFGHTGTVVMNEPDDQIFTNIPQFASDYGKLTEYLIQLGLFNTYRIRFISVYHSFPEKIRTADTLTVLGYLNDIREKSKVVFDNTDPSFSRERYINQFFGVTKAWDRQYDIQGDNVNNTLRIKGYLYISISNSSLLNNKLTMVNDILFTDNTSYHITLLYKILKEKLQAYIHDKNIKSFFVDHYKLPLWMALDIKYSGAVFSGLAKTAFRDSSFRQPYRALLNVLLHQDMITDIYSVISDHIVAQYNKFNNSDFRPSSIKGLLARLNRPEKFNNCSTSNREAAELFLVEGDSAKKNQGRDSRYQAMYTLGGKPFNGLTDISKLADAANDIKKNVIFQDIIRILNITPGSNDLSNLNFGKIFIMADADTHGYHITNIIIGNLYALCPALINEGHVYITMPPLYSLNIKGKKPIYIRDVTELNMTLAYYVYYRCLEIRLVSDLYDKVLDREEFVAFCDIIIRIGEELEKLSQEYMIPAVLLEQLALCTTHLDLFNPNLVALQAWLGCEVKYVTSGHMLIVSIGSDDIIVPLNQINELIYTRILPLYREFYYGRTRIFATTKNSTAMVNSPTSIVQLSMIFQKLNDMFTIERYKGLGSMESDDRVYNCIAPSTRRVFQITDIGDIDTIFNMLGTNPTERKKLVLR